MKKYVLAGASMRAYHMFAEPLTTRFKDYAQVAGVYDINTKRSEILGRECGGIPVFKDFNVMLEETKPDAVIVTTVDAYHHKYIIKALEAGCDAITEKPMTIDAEKCKAILEAEKRIGKKVIVTFNYRFAPFVTKIKEIVKSGTIGKVLSVDFEWMLDRNMDIDGHGTSYFRRWNRYMAKSGGLLVHKATHHFDLVNWWIDDMPEEVFAYGALQVYGKNRKEKGERCLTCDYKNTCEFYWDITKSDFQMKYYVEAEGEDGYYKDACVFADDIDIYDTMSLNVRYSGGAFLNYSLIAHAAYEGWRISINGTGGRLEAEEAWLGLTSDGMVKSIRVFNMKGCISTVQIPMCIGDHDGGDERLLRMLFVGDLPDPLGHRASSRDGAMSILVGASANLSIAEKRPVRIKEMLE